MAFQLGFHASHEQWPPSKLLEYVKRAGRAGFAAAMCSDHYLPWVEQQGHSGFAWSWLGAALEATQLSFGTVCAPGARYHPAVIAQAAATLAEMYPERFWLAIGSGEALNEHIIGQPWLAKPARNERLREAADCMRALWAGETVTHRGHIVVDRARLYTRPARPPLLFGAALTPETARWLGTWADGLITAGCSVDSLRKTIDAFRESAGAARPVYVQSAVCVAASEEKGLAVARREWPNAGIDPSQLADLEMPEDFAAATAAVSLDKLRGSIRVGDHPAAWIDWIASLQELGVQRLYLHHVGRNVNGFLELCAEHLLPAFMLKQ